LSARAGDQIRAWNSNHVDEAVDPTFLDIFEQLIEFDAPPPMSAEAKHQVVDNSWLALTVGVMGFGLNIAASNRRQRSKLADSGGLAVSH